MGHFLQSITFSNLFEYILLQLINVKANVILFDIDFCDQSI